jgi:hypothetical protein
MPTLFAVSWNTLGNNNDPLILDLLQQVNIYLIQGYRAGVTIFT